MSDSNKQKEVLKSILSINRPNRSQSPKLISSLNSSQNSSSEESPRKGPKLNLTQLMRPNQEGKLGINFNTKALSFKKPIILKKPFKCHPLICTTEGDFPLSKLEIDLSQKTPKETAEDPGCIFDSFNDQLREHNSSKTDGWKHQRVYFGHRLANKFSQEKLKRRKFNFVLTLTQDEALRETPKIQQTVESHILEPLGDNPKGPLLHYSESEKHLVCRERQSARSPTWYPGGPITLQRNRPDLSEFFDGSPSDKDSDGENMKRVSEMKEKEPPVKSRVPSKDLLGEYGSSGRHRIENAGFDQFMKSKAGRSGRDSNLPRSILKSRGNSREADSERNIDSQSRRKVAFSKKDLVCPITPLARAKKRGDNPKKSIYFLPQE